MANDYREQAYLRTQETPSLPELCDACELGECWECHRKGPDPIECECACMGEVDNPEAD